MGVMLVWHSRYPSDYMLKMFEFFSKAGLRTACLWMSLEHGHSFELWVAMFLLTFSDCNLENRNGNIFSWIQTSLTILLKLNNWQFQMWYKNKAPGVIIFWSCSTSTAHFSKPFAWQGKYFLKNIRAHRSFLAKTKIQLKSINRFYL